MHRRALFQVGAALQKAPGEEQEGQEQHRVEDGIDAEGGGHGAGRQNRGAVSGAQQAKDDPGLPAHFPGDPAHLHRQIAQRGEGDPGVQQPLLFGKKLRGQAFFIPGPQGPEHEAEHGEADAEHNPEGIEGQRNGRLVFPGKILETLDLAGERVGDEQAQAVGNFQKRPVVLLFFEIGPGQQLPGRPLTRRVGLPVSLDGGQFGGLVFGHGPAGGIPQPNLQRA